MRLNRKSRPPYRTPKSQEVLRQKAFETTFTPRGRNAQSGARSAKPRVVRGFVQLLWVNSQLEVSVLAEQASAGGAIISPHLTTTGLLCP